MAAPSTTVRGTPTGIKLRDGFSSKLAFSRAPALNIWEIEVKGTGIDGGEPIDQTTMFSTVECYAPGALKKYTPMTIKAAYDPIAFQTAQQTLINAEGSVTQTWPDGSKCDSYAYMKSIIKDPLVRNQRPTVTIEVIVTNWDPVNRVEVEPVYTLVAGS